MVAFYIIVIIVNYKKLLGVYHKISKKRSTLYVLIKGLKVQWCNTLVENNKDFVASYSNKSTCITIINSRTSCIIW